MHLCAAQIFCGERGEPGIRINSKLSRKGTIIAHQRDIAFGKFNPSGIADAVVKYTCRLIHRQRSRRHNIARAETQRRVHQHACAFCNGRFCRQRAVFTGDGQRIAIDV